MKSTFLQFVYPQRAFPSRRRTCSSESILSQKLTQLQDPRLPSNRSGVAGHNHATIAIFLLEATHNSKAARVIPLITCNALYWSLDVVRNNYAANADSAISRKLCLLCLHLATLSHQIFTLAALYQRISLHSESCTPISHKRRLGPCPPCNSKTCRQDLRRPRRAALRPTSARPCSRPAVLPRKRYLRTAIRTLDALDLQRKTILPEALAAAAPFVRD